MSMSVASDTCPGCGGEKIVKALLCRACRAQARRGPDHPNWKGGRSNACPDCGGSKRRVSERCQPCWAKSKTRFDDGRHVTAREWHSAYRRTPKGKRYVRSYNLRKYGITPEEYDAMLAAQDGVCAVCHQPETTRNQFGPTSLPVDHDHSTGQVRGLLCHRCNRALGLLGDSVGRVRELLSYLEKHKGGEAHHDHVRAS